MRGGGTGSGELKSGYGGGGGGGRVSPEMFIKFREHCGSNLNKHGSGFNQSIIVIYLPPPSPLALLCTNTIIQQNHSNRVRK